MSSVEHSSDSEETSDDDGNDGSDVSELPYKDEIDEFTPGDVSELGRKPKNAFKSLIIDSNNLSYESNYDRDKNKAQEKAFVSNHDFDAMPLEAAKKEVEFLVREVSESITPTTVEDADEITDDILADEPEAFMEQTREFAVAEETVECNRCEARGDSCSTCNGTTDVRCPNTNCYSGVIETECDQCNGTGEYYPFKDSTTKRECNKCNDYNRVKQGQCNTCGGNPPVGHPGWIKCRECDGSGRGDECDKCNGHGERVKQTMKTVEYSIVTASSVTGHQCAKDNPDEIEWEEIDSEVVDNEDAIASLPFDTPDEAVVRARVGDYDGMLYEARTKVSGNTVRVWVSDFTTVAKTHGRIEPSSTNFAIVPGVLLGGGIGWGVLFLAREFSIALPDIAGFTTELAYAVPILLVTALLSKRRSNYTFTAKRKQY